MRRIAQNFPAVLVRSALGVFACVYVFHHDRAACAADTRHFAQDLQWVLEMMQCQPANHHIERPIFEREIFRIGSSERDIGNPALLRALLPYRQHGVSQVNPNDFSRTSSERFRDVPRPGRDIQHALIALEPGCGHQAPNALLVRDPWIIGKSLGLCCERFPNDVVVLRHTKILAQASATRRTGSLYEFSA